MHEGNVWCESATIVYGGFALQPTNHLDLDTIEALIAALEAFEGAIVIVSHDVYFVERLVNPDAVYTVGKKKAVLKGIPST